MNSQIPEKPIDLQGKKRSADPHPPQSPPSWDEIFARIDEAEFPADFMADRNQGVAEERTKL